MQRTYGTMTLKGDTWLIEAEPHVCVMLKRIFKKIPKGASGVYRLTNTPETCRLLTWFQELYPFECKQAKELKAQTSKHIDRINSLNDIVAPNYVPRSFEMKEPGREYQRLAADLFLKSQSLLIADEVGLGKTCTAICALTDKSTLPAVVVCPAHLTRQWDLEINRFVPDLETHILKKSTPYPLPTMLGRHPDVILTSYHKMSGWADVLSKVATTIIFDEGQELRHARSDKYQACHAVAKRCKYRLALTATPIYNYGGEIFNLVNVLRPGVLGDWSEFCAEWCNGYGDKPKLKEPDAFGSWLREQHLMIRRTRRDVGRELPSLSKITQTVSADEKALEAIDGAAGELARIIMADGGGGFDKLKAAGDLDVMVRQATGIAKAPHVAAFVEMLLENGEPVVLFGWHRAVYDIWKQRLGKYSPAFYTGEESAARKHAEKQRFVSGETDLMIVSLRSGAGLDGLQKRCRTPVIGELDWSPGVHHQCLGRVHRDGQTDPVTAYFLISDSGSDPIIAEILGLKTEQIHGLIGESKGPIQQIDSSVGIRKIAERYLAKKFLGRAV